ncbi:MAG: dephospho-CoA kinase [Lachnospiraceae bacterium]|nr:dephospho-CoA kinase [Lachnospiraceae bacterium]
MRIIGITGGVGAGKSTVLNYIQNHLQCRIIYSDDLAKDLCVRGEVCFEPLVRLLGDKVLGSDGEIDKRTMASMIYADESLRQAVNDIIHPAVYDRIASIAEEERTRGAIRFLFIEAALLIECGYNEFVDEMWYVYASEPVRRERLKASRGYSDTKIDGIFASQLKEESFRAHSDFVIDNSGTPEESYSQILERMKEYE